MSSVLLNGRAADQAWARHRGLHYGDGVFRTCLVHRGAVVALDAQLARLLGDAARLQLQLQPADAELLRAECERLARAQDDGVLKIVLARASADRGYRSTSTQADRLVCLYPPSQYDPELWQRGLRFARSGFRLASQPRLAGIKHLNRLEQVLASRDCGSADEVLVEDARGRPLGGTRCNLFWAAHGELRTAALDECGVAGLTRERVIDAAQGAGIACRVAAGSWAELLDADEVFATNSIMGVCPVGAVGDRRWSAGGTLTRRLAQALAHPLPAAA
ncbi:MAG TPA: aminodeoxychorismate lyase [Candidatus Binatia bacterium]|nr:aminodeoxychorismate lyase [Candidatus Binatia bacterium]